MENEKYESTASSGFFAGSCAELIKEVDQGWRRFWKKRGFDPPPDLHKDTWFGREGIKYEKNSAAESKRKEAERIRGIQKAREEFLKGQGL